MVVPPKHPKMLILRENQWFLGTTILGNTGNTQLVIAFPLDSFGWLLQLKMAGQWLQPTYDQGIKVTKGLLKIYIN